MGYEHMLIVDLREWIALLQKRVEELEVRLAEGRRRGVWVGMEDRGAGVDSSAGGNGSDGLDGDIGVDLAPLSSMDLETVEREHIRRVLAYTKGNKVEAAKLLNIGLTTVYRKIEEYGL